MASYDKPNTNYSSECSWGDGMFPNPNVSYDKEGSVSGFPNVRPVGVGMGSSDDNYRDLVASKRSNVNDDSETLEDMYTAEGNPDRFGPAPALVQTTPTIEPPSPELEPVFRFERRR